MFQKSNILSIFSFLMIMVFLLANCTEPKPKMVNRDPNGTSELQLTMREMFDYFESVKADLEAGKYIDNIKAFEHILTDVPTEDRKNESAIYKTMSQVYFNAVEQMNNQKDKAAFERVVDACMSCHQQVCPGPMVKIKKLYTLQ